MKRNKALAIGFALTATTVLLLVYAASRLAYFFSFDPPSGSAATASRDEPPAGKQLEGITLSWDAVPGAQTYNLYWSTRPGVTRHTGNKISGVEPPFRFSRVHEGQTYYFVVTAVTDGGESRESAEIVYRPTP